MNLDIFQSDMGDCMLLEAETGHLMLCDGGMRRSLTAHVREQLSALRDEGREIDLVYVSHIDNDHISGVLQLLEDEAEWRVFDFHEQNDDPVEEPRVPRPPKMNGILHNAFRDQITANRRAIENLLVASAPSFFATAIPTFVQVGAAMQGIAAGIPEALKVSGLVGADALDIPVNRPPGVQEGQKLLFAGQPGDTFHLGSMKFTLIGPTKSELLSLRKGWQTWLANSGAEVKKIRAEIRRRIDAFSAGALSGSPYDLRDWNGVPDFKGVTAPNIASLMFLVEEDGKTLLLTGDAQQDFILAGLKRTGFMPEGFVHLDALKVQHHGSENNLDADFARRVSADHYVFCGDGSHGNPEQDVIDIIYRSRLGKPSERALAPQARDRDFHFWFSTTSAVATPGSEKQQTYEAMEAHVAELESDSGGMLQVHFNEEASIRLHI